MARRKLRLVIITGLSGAGRTEAVRCFEDIGYFCVDNLPPAFIQNLVELFNLPGSKIKNVAVVCDVRGQQYFPVLYEVMDWLGEKNIEYQILFLEANEENIVKRFKETRRKHPLSEQGEIIDGIRKEKAILENLKARANRIINTSNLEIYQLRDVIKNLFLGDAARRSIRISVISFGYKYGIPLDSDIVFDVRFLPNPHYIPELKDKTGLHEEIRSFVMGMETTKKFLHKIKDLVTFLIPHFIKEGKTHLVIAIGCTGGAHRSVTLADELAAYLQRKKYDVTLRHRDLKNIADEMPEGE